MVSVARFVIRFRTVVCSVRSVRTIVWSVFRAPRTVVLQCWVCVFVSVALIRMVKFAISAVVVF